MEYLVDKKISASTLSKEYLLEQKEVIKAAWTASKKLTSLFAPMGDKSRDMFETVANTVIPLDPNIRQCATRNFLDYVQGNDQAITNYLNSKASSKADQVFKYWLVQDMSAIQAMAKNTAEVITGNATLAYAASLEVSKVVTLDAPMLLAGQSHIMIQIENAKGLGIDLEKLNAGNGVLMPMGLSFEVLSIEAIAIEGQMVYTLRALEN